MKLIGSLTSPFVRKVRIVLAEKRLDYRFELEDVWADDSQIQQFNPLGKVPVLITDDGSAIFDSRVIVEYVDTLSPVSRLIPSASRERVDIKCWEALADGLLDAAVLINIEKTQRDEGARSAKLVARQQRKIDHALVMLSNQLGDKAFCTGRNYTLADIATGCALGYLDFRRPQLDWRARHANLAVLFEKLSQRASFIDTVPLVP
ncbi:glutathione S-transferase [Pigmentiphaga aceris]|uniref:Glutathione S-transferase n=1 Tax=Pigmentiphaga aceris TaxID=1940612 RepID=A0A5C0B1P1_9BURK|nr:glutathione S-transferase [Pigmentiphaga aceris]QEI07906.1 glutathione S-transferase [Pigmentiphaga aceris]